MPTRGSTSKTMRGKKDYTTKKGSKFYVRDGHEIRPYKQNRKGGFAFLPFLAPLLAGLASGGVSYGTQKLLKKKFGNGKRKH